MTEKKTVKVLITGFKPYRNITVNTAAEVAAVLGKSEIDGADIHTAVLPVSFSLRRANQRVFLGRHFLERKWKQLIVCFLATVG